MLVIVRLALAIRSEPPFREDYAGQMEVSASRRIDFLFLFRQGKRKYNSKKYYYQKIIINFKKLNQ